ncbi:MAG TPA: VacB/RNase II family 3'-5' exoribonuclease, partial [Bdellovibrionota bacterium]|nr:VacB/RNase II family 3'-5' exoribonuclease [Bdellovibrionota bacterium]
MGRKKRPSHSGKGDSTKRSNRWRGRSRKAQERHAQARAEAGLSPAETAAGKAGSAESRPILSDRPAGIRPPPRPQGAGNPYDAFPSPPMDPPPKRTGQPRGPRPERGFRPERGPSRAKDAAREGGRGAGSQVLTATLEKNPKGFGFLIFDDRDFEDLHVPAGTASEFLHGDRVEVTLRPGGEVTRFRTVGHQSTEIWGRVSANHPSAYEKGVWVVAPRRSSRLEVYAPAGAPGAKVGDWVRAQLLDADAEGRRLTCKVVEVIGPEVPAKRDIELVAAEYGLQPEPSEASRREASTLPHEPAVEDFADRSDLRNVPLITIDGETARDFDDAVYVERQGGGYVLWVAIADVSHYVRPGTAMDQDAFSRGTSVYLPERAFHMLPRELSENLCSLRPNVPRLALTAKMTFDKGGTRTGFELLESVIRSHRRATYTEIKAEYDANGSRKDWEFAPHFELFRILKKRKTARGALDFDLPEEEILVDANGEPVSTRRASRTEANMLIEEFMIAANEAVTEWALKKGAPFLYRIHEEPSLEAFEKFRAVAKAVGFTVPAPKSLRDPRVISDIVKRIEDHAAKPLLHMSLLRSMRQAIYSASHGIHYGLGSQAYTHFTSPIRRYPDLVVHRQLRMLLTRGDRDFASAQDRKKMNRDLHAAAVHCSYRERLADRAEGSANKIKEVRLMARRLGEEFAGLVRGMTERGLYVQIGHDGKDPWIEGVLPKDTLPGDRWEFNPDRLIFYGIRKKKVIKIGDAVKVRAVRSDFDRR